LSNTVKRFQVSLRAMLIGLAGGAVLCIVAPAVLGAFFGVGHH